MNRNFHIVDYITEMSRYCSSAYDLNNSFTITSEKPNSKYSLSNTIIGSFNTFNFNNNVNYEPFIQQFEELNPLGINNVLHHVIYPNIKFTIPKGFNLSIESLIPGIKVKHIKSLIKPGILYLLQDEITIPKSTTVGIQHTRLLGNPSLYYMQHVKEIIFEIASSNYIRCTKTGFIFLKDTYPETNILNISFTCLQKQLPEAYNDMPNIEPLHGCDNQFHYNLLHIIRNAKLFNYMY